LWILDGATHAEDLSTSSPAVTIELSNDRLTIGGRLMPTSERPSEARHEWRFWLLVADGRLSIIDARSERPLTRIIHEVEDEEASLC